MNQEEIQQQIAFYYSKLPPEAQAIFSSMQWLETLKGISTKYVLTEEQQQTLGTETTLVMLSVINPTEYEDTIRNKMGIAKDVADKVYAEINESVLKTIRLDLSATFQKNTAVAPEENKLIENGLDERFKKMPAVVRDAINESDYKAIIYAIAKDQNLTLGQTDRLELCTADLMLGTISNEKYVELIQTELSIPMEKAMSLVDAVNEKVLKKIRGLMMAAAPAAKLENKEHAIMKGAGIEIVGSGAPITQAVPATTPAPSMPSAPVKLDLPEIGDGKTASTAPVSGPVVAPAPEPIPEPVPAPVTPIFGQKLAGSFQIESTQTEHTVANITPSAPAAVKPPTPKAYPPKGDPYRLSPDE